MSRYYIGIEGGATSSTVVVLDEVGSCIGELKDEPPTNHWNCGIEECCNQLARTIRKIKAKAGIPENQGIAGIGLCLSGCEEVSTNEKIKLVLHGKVAGSGLIVVTSDTVGPLYAVSKLGGVVLIAGTGSNCLLINPDKSQARCGGWSYMAGDEGGAFWIAHKAVKYCVDENDNFEKAPFDVSYAWNKIKLHFGVKDNFGMLHHWYQEFNKAFYAELTVELAEGAKEGDKFCQHLFELAGQALAKHLLAVRGSIDPKLHDGELGLPIVCIGSVFKSWELLKPGFMARLGLAAESPALTKFSLVRLTVSSAIGAALLSAPTITTEYSKNLQVIYSHGL